MHNPAAKAVRSPRFKQQKINGERAQEATGCNICGDAAAPQMPHLEHIHGHVHCTWCGQNVDPCCQGEA